MASYDFPQVEALRWQLARFFPELIASNRFSCIRVNSQATADNTKKRTDGPYVSHNNNVQATIWHRFENKITPVPRQSSPADIQKAERLRQLYIQYRELVWEADKEIVADDPVIYQVLRYMHSDLDKAIAALQTALDGDRAAETVAYNRSLDEWQQTWQEKRQPTETTTDTPPDPQPAALDPTTTMQLPLPPPLPPCLQCVMANACCSLTTAPYARAYVDDLAGPPAKSGVSQRLPLQKIVDEHARLTAEHGSCDNNKNESGSTATLTEKKRAFNQRLLLEAVIRGDCDSPFLPEPPAQCVRCQRLGDRGCLQQSRDLTGMTDTLALDKHGHHKCAWFASRGPPPRSLLRHHCPSLLRQMTESAAPDTLHDTPRLKKRPILEAIYCRDDAVLSAAQVADKARQLLERIHRRSRWRAPTDTASDAEPLLGTKSPTTPIAANAAAPAVPQISKEPVPAAAPTVIARRLPKDSSLDVYAGEALATTALPETRDKNDGEQAGFGPAGASNLLRRHGPKGDEAAPPTRHTWRSYALGVGVDQEGKDEKVRERLAKCKESLGKAGRVSMPAKKSDWKGKGTVSRDQLQKLADKYGISERTVDRLLWRKG